MQPTNLPISGGVLRVPIVQSPNYVAGSTGWAIKQDGTAEFNNLTARGTLSVGPAAPAQGAAQYGLTGTQIPAVLRNFSADYTWLVADIRWISNTDFFFTALVNNTAFAVLESITGVYTTGNGVQIQTLTEDSANTLNYGSSVYDTARMQINWRLADLTFTSDCTVTASGTALLSSQSAGTTNAYRANVSGDTQDRHTVDANGKHSWGPGGATVTDTVLYRSSAGVIAADRLVHNVSGAAETWHTATLVNSWTGTFRYRIGLNNTIDISANVVPGTKTDGTTLTTLPAGYRPATATDVACAVGAMAGANAQSPHFNINTSGVVTCWGWGSATGGSANGSIPLD